MASLSTPTIPSSMPAPQQDASPTMEKPSLIASAFVKQYYTLLNKAPCYIHNFYSQDSTFIYGTVEMAKEQCTEPILGRENIKKKMEDLKLHDCRAKIKQIDCLETLAGGLVIMVIGELSNNGKPMRRFLQTFVLAPSNDQDNSRQYGVLRQHNHQPKGSTNAAAAADHQPPRRPHLNESNNVNPTQHQKFFVLNSIFRYEDDGTDSEFEDDTIANVDTNTSKESANGDNEFSRESHNPPQKVTEAHGPAVTVRTKLPQHHQSNVDPETKNEDNNSSQPNSTNMPVNNEKKNESSLAKSNDEAKIVHTSEQQQQQQQQTGSVTTTTPTTNQVPNATTQPPQISSAPRPHPPSEPKTWANMVRNAPQTTQQTSVGKNIAPQGQSQSTTSNQPSAPTHQQPQAHQQHLADATQADRQNNNGANSNNNNSNNNSNNNRRRHMLRKSSNKPAGRSMKNRPPRPPATGKPSA